MTDNERLKSSDLFDFDKWTYNVLREDVENNFFQKIFTFKKYRTRYWISAVKGDLYNVVRGPTLLSAMQVLFYYYSPINSIKIFYFSPVKYLSDGFYKIKYWNNSQEPIDIIRHLRAKLDVEALPENLVFSSDDF